MKGFSVLDCHVHYALPISREALESALAAAGADMANLVIVPDRGRISSVPDALAYKHAHPHSTYVFSSFDVSEYMRHKNAVGKKMKAFVKRMLVSGCDGVKIIEGKPDMRRMLPVPDFDASVWEPFWAWAEKTGLPILWHVNDPEEFWDSERIPEFAKKSGWFYGPETINNEEQYRQVLTVLERHPKLKIIFAHMFFLSAQLERLSSYLRRYENICVDLTPGIELYQNMSKTPEAARAFFEEFSDRILYGTDIGARAVISHKPLNEKENVQRVYLCRTFLEHDGEFSVTMDGNFLMGEGEMKLFGLGLSDDSLKKIYRDNFLRLVGAPRRVNKANVLKECNRLRFMMKIMARFDKNFVADFSAVDDVTAYFRKKTARTPKNG